MGGDGPKRKAVIRTVGAQPITWSASPAAWPGPSWAGYSLVGPNTGTAGNGVFGAVWLNLPRSAGVVRVTSAVAGSGW